MQNGFNRNRIQGYLKSCQVCEAITREYEDPLSKLLTLRKNLQETDLLVDEIVFKHWN